jgi:6-phosphogluconolactonase
LDKTIKIFPTPELLAEGFAKELIRLIKVSSDRKKTFTIALSGGSTPELLFTILGDQYSGSVAWEYVHLFWGDERCVPPESTESNFRMVKTKLIDKILIPAVNVHRIKGEAEPEIEAERYSEVISALTGKRNGLPSFDMIILGLGEDGHTASVFPGHLDLFKSNKICTVASHPVTKQKRITLTGQVINNAEAVVFLVTGKRKAEIVKGIIKKDLSAPNYPASLVVPASGYLSWFIDKDAASLL